ncbi:MAG: DNA polymerase III subunit delta' [Candidatus Thioglobus sp.]|nr:MAG: DNA polymerase III subunit delta' [Candidatus Thioglobus sp.]KAA0450105.1 MAG: DNA polymerase III subunit delta' [Candidatus Thioglobus sp.]
MTNKTQILPWHKIAMAKLEQMIEQNHLPHALMITGVRKIGKFELMQRLVSKLLEDEGILADNAREDLDYPVLIRRSNYANMIYCRAGEINPTTKNRSKEILIPQVRAFCEALNKTADGLQIGVIFYADEMNISAANALLKTLEEPRKNTLIILLAHNSKNLPATIISRCQSVHISPAFDEQTLNWIEQNIENKEDFDVEKLLETTHGVPFKVIEELSGEGFIDYQHWQNQLLNIAIHPTMIGKIEGFEGNEVAVLNCLQHLIIEGIRLKSLNNDGGLLELNQIIATAKIQFLFALLADIQHAISLAKTTINIKLLLDNVLIVWSHITHLKTYPKILTG